MAGHLPGSGIDDVISLYRHPGCFSPNILLQVQVWIISKQTAFRSMLRTGLLTQFPHYLEGVGFK